jgi:hypothetical protein
MRARLKVTLRKLVKDWGDTADEEPPGHQDAIINTIWIVQRHFQGGGKI